MLLAIDRGNTKDKFVVFDENKIILDSSNVPNEKKKFFVEKNNFFLDINEFFLVINKLLLHNKLDLTECVFSSVKSDEDNREFVSIASQYYNVRQITFSTPLPFKNLYKSDSLGTDRICAVAGANCLFGTNILVIDVGTCITFDYLNNENCYLGGSISPSFRIKFEALHNFTANLPLITSIDEVDLISNSTKDCIQSGVINGTINEIVQTINLYKQQYKGVRIVITGGDGKFVCKHLLDGVEYEENLVFWGLKNIYEYNEQKNK